MEIKKFENNNLVIQANALISASYKLNLQEKRLILALIAMINRDDEDFKTYKFRVKDLASLFNIAEKNYYDRVANNIIKLRKKDVIIKTDKSILYTGWLSSADYYYKEGFVELSFDPKLKPYLLKLKEQFTQYALENIVKLRSIYSIRLYELMRQYMNTKQKIRIIEIEDFRAQLGLIEYDRKNNIIKEKFKLYGHIKDRILKPAQKELKKKTDICFEFQEIKTGRKVTAIKFFMKENIKSKELPLSFSDDKKNYEFNKAKVEIAVLDIIKETNDNASKNFYYKIAWAFILNGKEDLLMQALSELKADCAHFLNKGAAFTIIIKRIAEQANIIDI